MVVYPAFSSREKSYSGGGKLTCSGTLDTSSIFKTRIFEGELYLGILPIHISYSVSDLINKLVA